MDDLTKPISIITVKFDLPVHYEDLSLFRGAVIETTGRSNDLFHNHSGEGVIYRYPYIQYKKIGGKAALVCFDKGTEAIHNFFSNTDWKMRIGERNVEIRVEDIRVRRHTVAVWENSFRYSLTNWMPLNQQNYQKYHSCESFSGKMEVLESVLLGNILTFCEGFGLHPEKKIKAAIQKVMHDKLVWYRGQRMQAFDIEFSSNVSIPDYAALGKGGSIGFGTVMTKRSRRGSGMDHMSGDRNFRDEVIPEDTKSE